MPRMTIKLKIGGGFLLAGIMMLVSGLAGLYLAFSLSGALGTFTGPVMQTTANANAGMLSVQAQLVAVKDILASNSQEARSILQQEEDKAFQALEQIQQAGRIGEERFTELKTSMENFRTAKDQLLQNHSKYVALENQIDKTVSYLMDYIIDIERLASQALLESRFQFEDEAVADADSATASDEERAADEQAASDAEELVNANKDLVNSAGEARLALLNRLNLLNRFRKHPADADIKQRLAQVYEDLTYAGEVLADNDVMRNKTIENGEFQGASYADMVTRLINDHGNEFTEAMRLFTVLKTSREAYSKEADALINFGRNLLADIDVSVTEERTALDSVLDNGTQTILGVMLVGLLLGIAMAYVLIRAIIQPIQQVQRQVDDMAAGEGDLTIRLQVKGDDEVADLANSFNAFTDKLRGIIQTLQNHIDQLVDSTSSISSVAEKTRQLTQRQQSELSGVVVAINNLSSGSQQVVTNTSAAANGASLANEQAQKGQVIMQKTIDRIKHVASDVDGATLSVNELGAKSDQIGVVLEVIRTISEQTNLLALNAAIEAARAGEQGRGFAVVADEVRGLAARTHDSIGEIQEIIDQLQSGTSKVMQQMESVKANSNDSVQPVTDAGETLNSISQAVEEITRLNAEIAGTAETQSQTASDVDNNIVNINDMAVESAENAETLMEATHTLSRLGDELQQLARQFKVS
ncbi:MAG: methyl-accepting chemotaxis protein [Chromatiales bacterium]